MTQSTPRSRAFDVLAASLELKVATDVGAHDTAGRAAGRLRIALDAVLYDVVAADLARQDPTEDKNLMETGQPGRPLEGREQAP